VTLRIIFLFANRLLIEKATNSAFSSFFCGAASGVLPACQHHTHTRPNPNETIQGKERELQTSRSDCN